MPVLASKVRLNGFLPFMTIFKEIWLIQNLKGASFPDYSFDFLKKKTFKFHFEFLAGS